MAKLKLNKQEKDQVCKFHKLDSFPINMTEALMYFTTLLFASMESNGELSGGIYQSYLNKAVVLKVEEVRKVGFHG